MATTGVAGNPLTVTVERRKVRPIIGWAVLGAIFLGCALYLLASWILSGEAVRQPPGATPVPMYTKIFLNILQVAFPVGLVLAAYRFLVRPWMRERRITSDGLLCLAFALLWWQDPLADFMGPWSIYNTYPLNFGSWLGRVPGVLFPQAAKLAEPLLLTIPSFLAFLFPLIVGINSGMRRVQARWPNLSNFWLIAGLLIFCTIFDFVNELFCVWAGWYTFPGALKGWSLFSNQYIRFPIYEAILIGIVFTLFACLRYFKNDKGETIAERGSDRLRSMGVAKTVIRFLALTGAVNVIYFCAYNVPAQYFSVNSDDFPKSITDRSYFIGDICGPGTTYMCPGPKVPIPRRDSARVGPDGKLVPAK